MANNNQNMAIVEFPVKRANLHTPKYVRDMLQLLYENAPITEIPHMVIDEVVEFLQDYNIFPFLGIAVVNGDFTPVERKENYSFCKAVSIPVNLTAPELDLLKHWGSTSNSTAKERSPISKGFLMCIDILISKRFFFDKKKADEDKKTGLYSYTVEYVKCNVALTTSIGSKKSVMNDLKNLIPEDTETLIEGFGRTASMTAFSGIQFPNGIVNELQEGWVTMLDVVKRFPIALYMKLQSSEYTVDKDTHDRIQAKPISGYNHSLESRIERAADLIYLNNTSYNGTDGNSFNVECSKTRIKRCAKAIFGFAYRLKRVILSQLDIEEFIRQFQMETKTFHFVDPPYYETIQYSNSKLREVTDDEFAIRLRQHYGDKEYDKLKAIAQLLKKKLYADRKCKLSEAEIGDIVDAWIDNHCLNFFDSRYGRVIPPAEIYKNKSTKQVYEAIAQLAKHFFMISDIAKRAKKGYVLLCHYPNDLIDEIYKVFGFVKIGQTSTQFSKSKKITYYYGNKNLCAYLRNNTNWCNGGMEIKDIRKNTEGGDNGEEKT